MIPIAKVKSIVDTYKTLEKELASGNIDKKDFVKKSKEYSSIGEVIDQAKGYLSFEKEKIELEKIIEDKGSDKEMVQLAKKELNELLEKNKIYEKILKVHLLPKDEADTKNAILEIRAGTGGDEAGLFVADLYKMYEKITVANWVMFAMRNYDNPQCEGEEEFYEDIKRFKYLKRLFKKYYETGNLKERLILNHMIILSNVLGVQAASTLLLFKIEQDYWPAMSAFMKFLNMIPEGELNLIEMDDYVWSTLKKNI